MKSKRILSLALTALIGSSTLSLSTGQIVKADTLPIVGVTYRGHVQNIGWQNWVNDGGEAGTDGKGYRVEAFKLALVGMPGYTVQYRAHVQNIGWQSWVSDGAEAGTDGKGLRFEALEIKIVKTTDGSTPTPAAFVDANGNPITGGGITTPINVTSISLNRTTDSLNVGDTDTLTQTVAPSNATNKNVKWTSSNNAVATVDATGKVTGITSGTASITATTADGNKAASCTVTVNAPSTNNIVTFKDEYLEKAIRTAVNKPTDTIYKSDVASITKLDVNYNGITDISGIENLTNLRTLDLNYNNISDISGLKNLTNLHTLNLGNNKIIDISSLKGLSNLDILNLQNNKVNDLSPLQGITNLYTLSLDDNQISDITPLSNLKNLNSLTLNDNQISDVTPLNNLTNLTTLYLDSNQISNVTPLNNLANLTTLYLYYNPLNDANKKALKEALPNCYISF